MRERHACVRNANHHDTPEFVAAMNTVKEIIKAGLIEGYLQAVVRPDGQIGYAPTDKAMVAFREDGE